MAEAAGGRRMVRIFASTLSAELLTRGVALAASLVVVRALSPGQFGDFAYALAFASVLGVAVDLGFSTFVVRDVSEEPGRAPRLLGGVLKAQALLAVVVFGGASALAFAGVLGGPAGGLALTIGFAFAAAGTAARTFEAVLIAHDRAHLITLARVARGAALVIATAVAALADAQAEGFLAAWLAAELTSAALTGIYCATRAARPDFAVPRAEVRRLMALAVPFALLAGFSLIYQRIDLVMLGLLDTDVATGNYGVAARILETLLIFPMFFGAAFLATVAHTGAHTERAAPQTERALRYILLLCVPLAFTLALTGEPLVSLVAGDDYDQAGELLVRLSPVLVLVAGYGVISSLQVALDRVGTLVRINVAGVVLKVGLNLWAIPAHGAEGAAVTAVAAEAVVVTAQWYVIRSELELGPLLRWTARLALCTAAAVGAALAVGSVGPWPAALAAGLAAYALAAWSLRCASVADVRSIVTSLRVRTA